MKRKPITLELLQKLAVKRDGKCLADQYVGPLEKYDWQCSEGHIWKAKYGHIRNNRWCPECYRIRRTPTVESMQKLAVKQKGKCLSEKYINSKTKYKWQCECGNVFRMNYNNVQQGQWCQICAEQKRINTRIKKYGAPYLMQNKELALKSAKNNNLSSIYKHWRTKEELVCVGSYEAKTVKWLNENKIDFEWQPKIFEMPCGKTYRPDLFLISEGIWVEIKGYFRKDAEEKWEWFSCAYPNSQLWDKQKLKELDILP